jgi:hypothetical protein
MDKQIADANLIAAAVNADNATAQARVWTATDDKGNVTKVRVYIAKGYIDLRANNSACYETVGRTYFPAAKSAVAAAGYDRAFA